MSYQLKYGNSLLFSGYQTINHHKLGLVDSIVFIDTNNICMNGSMIYEFKTRNEINLCINELVKSSNLDKSLLRIEPFDKLLNILLLSDESMNGVDISRILCKGV